MKWTNIPNPEWNKLFPKKKLKIMRGKLGSEQTGIHGFVFGEISRINEKVVLILFRDHDDIFTNRDYSWSICIEDRLFPRVNTDTVLRILKKYQNKKKKPFIRRLFGYFIKDEEDDN